MDETDVPEDGRAAYVAALGHERRRAVVKVVAEEDRPLDLSPLARWLTGREDVERTMILLHHVHLPRLDVAGLVNYSPEEHRIRPADGTSAGYGLLEQFP